MFGPVRTGVSVILRPPGEADAELLVAWFADREVTRFLKRPFPLSLEEERDWLKRTGEATDTVWWMVEVDGRSVGATGIHRIDWLNAHATTGTLIGEKGLWGRGHGSEVMRLRTAYAFQQLNLHKLSSGTFAENERSRRALYKAGYREIGVEREHIWREGAWHDHWRCEILRSDWEPYAQQNSPAARPSP